MHPSTPQPLTPRSTPVPHRPALARPNRRSTIATSFLTLFLASPLHAQPDPPAPPVANARVSIALDDAAFDRTLAELSAVLVDAPQLATAADHAMSRLAVDWASPAVLRLAFGLPTDDQRRLVLAQARRAVTLAQHAEGELERAFDAAEKRGLFDDDDARPALDDAVLIASVVLPLARARAELLAAAAQTPPDQATVDPDSEPGAAVRRALETLERVRPVSAWSEAERAATLAVATLLANRHDVAEDAARAALAALRNDPRLARAAADPDSAPAGLRRAARLVIAHALRHRRAWPDAAASLDDAQLPHQLALSARLRLGLLDARQAHQQARPNQAAATLDAAAAPLARLLIDDDRRRQLGITEAQARELLSPLFPASPPAALALASEGLTLALALTHAQPTGAVDPDPIERLIRRRGRATDQPAAARQSLRDPFRNRLAAELAHARLRHAIESPDPPPQDAPHTFTLAAVAAQDALALAADPEIDDELDRDPALRPLIAAALLDAANFLHLHPLHHHLARDAALAVVDQPGRRLRIDEAARDFWRRRLALDFAARAFDQDADLDDDDARGRLDRALDLLADVVHHDDHFEQTIASIGESATASILAHERRTALAALAADQQDDQPAVQAPHDPPSIQLPTAADALRSLRDLTRSSDRRALYDAVLASADQPTAPRNADTAPSADTDHQLTTAERLTALHFRLRHALTAFDAPDANAALDAMRSLPFANTQDVQRESLAAVVLAADDVLEGVRSIQHALPQLPGREPPFGDPDQNATPKTPDRRAETLTLLADTLASDPRVPDALRLRAVTALLHADPPGDALRLATVLNDARAATPTHAQFFRLLLADALLFHNDQPAAFAIYRDVAATTPPERRDRRPYWHASARMLQILAIQNRDGSRDDVIRREINRLKLQPAWNAFEDCTSAIETVEAALDR